MEQSFEVEASDRKAKEKMLRKGDLDECKAKNKRLRC